MTERNPSAPAPDWGAIPDERTTSQGADDPDDGDGRDALEFRPGDRIDHGKYEIISRLGGGGFGEVWKARHVTTRGDRAIKVISPRLVQDDSTLLARFRREAEVLEKIREPHIVEIKDFIEIEGVPCIIMEFIDGQTLRDLLNEKDGPLELPRAARLLKQICEVLQHAHDHGVVHRDLKPENLMLEAGREPGKDYLKVLDFGIAKVRFEQIGDAVVDSHTITQAGAEPPLTPAYGSPEQVQSQPLDHRSDIYSLGVILFEMLAGQRPFQGNMAALMHAHAFEKPPAFTTLNPLTTCSRTIESVVRRCLEKDPADRYQQARDLWNAFKAALPAEIKVDTTQIVSKMPQPTGEFQLNPGDRLDHDKYEVISRIGGGGFGDVWKVRHLGTKGLRAIKVFSPKRTKDDPTFLTRFRREAEVMEKLKDQRIVQIYDYITIGEIPAIVMEYIEGDTLRSRLKQREGPLDLREIALILYPLCRVLQKAHDLGVVHRDLKPENLMLQPGQDPGEEVLKVLDFGIAKVHSEGVEESSPDSHLTIGGEGPPLTPAYASPEQVRGLDLDHRSDLYTVGVILFELITGQRPFEGNQTHLLMAHGHQAPPKFAQVNPRCRCPRSIEKVVLQCLEKNPGDRYRTATDLWTAFRAALPREDRPTTETGGKVAPPPPQPFRIPWRAIATTIGCLCLTAIVSLVAWKLVWDPQPPPPVDPYSPAIRQALDQGDFQPADAAEPDPKSGWPRAIIDRSHRQFLLVDTGERTGGVWIGRYLPDDYEVVTDEPPDEIQTVSGDELPDPTARETPSDGWPQTIRRKGSEPEVLLRRIPAPRSGTVHLGNNSPVDANHYRGLDAPLTEGFYLQETEVTNGEILAAALSSDNLIGDESVERWIEGMRDQAELMKRADFPATIEVWDQIRAIPPSRWREYAEPLRNLPDALLDAPAVKWTWDEAANYARARHGSLPREVQWEYAAGSCRNWKYPWGPSLTDDYQARGNVERLEGFQLEVKQRILGGDLSLQGIWDLAGSVQEWCLDNFMYYPDNKFVGTKQAAENKAKHVIRGSSFDGNVDMAAAYSRRPQPADRSSNVGFRIVVEGKEFQTAPREP